MQGLNTCNCCFHEKTGMCHMMKSDKVVVNEMYEIICEKRSQFEESETDDI